MLELGTHRVQDYRPRPAGLIARLRWFPTRHISLRLLRTSIPATPLEIEIFETIMKHLQLESGIYRTTFRGRFRELDRFVTEAMVRRFPREAALQIHDWAASDCVTAAEWGQVVFSAFPDSRLQASDLTLYLLEIALPNGGFFITERGGEPLQYIRAPFLASMRKSASQRLRERFEKVQSQIRIPSEWLEGDAESIALPPFTVQKLSVVHPEAEALRRSEKRFSIARHSAFDSLAAPVDAIRSMNIFNLAYFSAERLAEGARAVWRSLRPGGWWIVGRTWRDDPPASNVSIFEKDEQGFRLIDRFGEGSEIESIVLEQSLEIR
jgi:hypothetical protein